MSRPAIEAGEIGVGDSVGPSFSHQLAKLSPIQKLAINGVRGDLLEADLWGVRGSHRNKGVSQAGFTYRPSPSTTTGMGRASVGMFRFPQSVNCSVRRLFSI